MTRTTIHRKANGAAYVYSVESYWDKEKKAPRNRQICLGRLNEETGEIIPSKRMARMEKGAKTPPEIQASAKVHGPYTVLMKLAKDLGLLRILHESFPSIHEEILSLTFFLVQNERALSRCEFWSENNDHPYGHPLTSQRVRELLTLITENDRQHFLSLWLKQLDEKEMLCYNTTSISSYAKANEYVCFWEMRNNEKLQQTNLAMLFGQESGLPAYYRRMPWNTTDASTLQTMIDTLDCLGKTKLQFVLDHSFYSEKNVDALLNKQQHFVLMVPSHCEWLRNIIEQHMESIASPEHYRQTDESETLYMISHLHHWKNHSCYVHLYYNASRAAEEFDKLTKKLVLCKKELETEDLKEENKELYEKLFIVKRTPKRGLSVTYNDAEIQKYRNQYAGFFCIMTNVKMESDEVLEIYRRRNVVENCFDGLENERDVKRLRVHSPGTMDSRIFIQFIALILMSKIREITKKAKELRYMTIREIMEAMESVVRITYAGRDEDVITEIGSLQREICGAFGVELNS